MAFYECISGTFCRMGRKWDNLSQEKKPVGHLVAGTKCFLTVKPFKTVKSHFICINCNQLQKCQKKNKFTNDLFFQARIIFPLVLGTCSNLSAERVPSTKQLFPIKTFFFLFSLQSSRIQVQLELNVKRNLSSFPFLKGSPFIKQIVDGVFPSPVHSCLLPPDCPLCFFVRERLTFQNTSFFLGRRTLYWILHSGEIMSSQR